MFVHATRLTRTMWRAQVDALTDRFRVVALDLPGHGALADQPFTLDAAADQVAAVIEATDDGRPAVVVGLSLGGYVAMHLVSRRPELVRGLVLSGATAEPVSWRGVPYRVLAVAMDRGAGRRLDRLNASFFRRRFPPAVADPIVAGGFWYAGGAQALRALVGQRFTERLAVVSKARPCSSTARTTCRSGCPPRRSRGPRGIPVASVWPGRRTSPTSTDRRPSREAVARFTTSLGPTG